MKVPLPDQLGSRRRFRQGAVLFEERESASDAYQFVHGIGLDVIAEGIEELGQDNPLSRMPCEYRQLPESRESSRLPPRAPVSSPDFLKRF